MVGGVLVAGTLITVLIDVLIPMPLYFAAIIGLSIALVKSCFVIASSHLKLHFSAEKGLNKTKLLVYPQKYRENAKTGIFAFSNVRLVSKAKRDG